MEKLEAQSQPDGDEETSFTSLPADLQHLIFDFLVKEPTGLAQLCACACVSKAWRDLAYEPAHWRSLTNWVRLSGAEKEIESEAEAVVEEVKIRAALDKFIGRSQGTLEHFHARDAMDLTAPKVIATLRKFGCEGKLLSLEVHGVQIKTDGSSLAELKNSLAFRVFLSLDHLVALTSLARLGEVMARETSAEEVHEELVRFMKPA